jgi:hypothetical protein
MYQETSSNSPNQCIGTEQLECGIDWGSVEWIAIEDAITLSFGQLSLNALAGTDVGEAMKIRALVNNKIMLILVDSGCLHSFVNQAFLTTARL